MQRISIVAIKNLALPAGRMAHRLPPAQRRRRNHLLDKVVAASDHLTHYEAKHVAYWPDQFSFNQTASNRQPATLIISYRLGNETPIQVSRSSIDPGLRHRA